MEIGNTEGAIIALMLKHYKAHFDLKQKIDFFFMKFAQFEEWIL